MAISLPTQEPLFAAGTVLPVATYNYGPFVLGDYRGFLLDMTRSDDGVANTGTCTVGLYVDDLHLGLITQLDGAGAAVAMNDWAATELVRRQLQVHPTAGPQPSSDADGVFTVGTTGVASSYYRQPVQEPFWFRVVVGTDTSTFTGAVLYFLR
jgi:hypothetical protein